MPRMPILSDTDMSLFELKTRFVRNYFTYAGKNSNVYIGDQSIQILQNDGYIDLNCETHNAYDAHVTTDCPFDFWTDIDSQATFTITSPATVRGCLGGMDGSMLDTYGGEYEWDMYTATAAYRLSDTSADDAWRLQGLLLDR